jgi:hypothetical protein
VHALTKHGGSVIWTMHRRPPDQVPEIAGWFEREGFEAVWATDPPSSTPWRCTGSGASRGRSPRVTRYSPSSASDLAALGKRQLNSSG